MIFRFFKKNIGIPLAFLIFFSSPFIMHAQTAATPEGQPRYLIVCDGANASSSDPEYDKCDYNDLWELINKGVNFIIFLSLLISTFVFLYAGFLYLTSGISDKKSDAKKMMFNVVKGIIIILISWLVINTLLKAFGLREEYNRLEEVEVNP